MLFEVKWTYLVLVVSSRWLLSTTQLGWWRRVGCPEVEMINFLHPCVANWHAKSQFWVVPVRFAPIVTKVLTATSYKLCFWMSTRIFQHLVKRLVNQALTIEVPTSASKNWSIWCLGSGWFALKKGPDWKRSRTQRRENEAGLPGWVSSLDGLWCIGVSSEYQGVGRCQTTLLPCHTPLDQTSYVLTIGCFALQALSKK